MTDHTKALADFHAFFRDRCEALFATFGPEAVALYNAAGATSLTVGDEPTDDQCIELAAALEMHRALHIVAEVAGLPMGGKDADAPTPFHAGYQLACEEIAERIRTQEVVIPGGAVLPQCGTLPSVAQPAERAAPAEPQTHAWWADWFERLKAADGDQTRAMSALPDAMQCHPGIKNLYFAGMRAVTLARDAYALRDWNQPAAQAEPADFTDWGRAAVAWVLWHHQGGSSAIGQPLRFALGLGAHEPLPAHLVASAQEWAKSVGATTDEFHRQKAAQAEPVELPHPGSPEASAMIDSVLAEYQWPTNAKNAARAGYVAAKRMLRAKPSNPPAQGIGAASEPGVKEA